MTDIVVYGRGKTGQSIAKMLQKQGKRTIFFDDVTGFDRPAEFTSDSVVIVSPGVPPAANGITLARKAGAKIVGELEYCFPLCKGRCISVTGTNGKTTVCEMIYAALKNSGFPTRLLGNGGVPFSSQVLEIAKSEMVVLESSSFQLADCKSFAPFVSVLTNVAPDHIDWHGGFDEYVQAKKNNFIHQREGFAVFNKDDAVSVALSADCACQTLFYSTSNGEANCFFDGESVVLRHERSSAKVYAPFLAEFLRHNLSNALAAVLACCCVGVDPDKAVGALKDFVFLPHRMQSAGEIDGVYFVNDSKATNVHATVNALKCFENDLALIVGGSDKGEEYDEIFRQMKDNVKAVVAVGQTSHKIARCGLQYGIAVKIMRDFKDAVRYCFQLLRQSGGTVLMSNACASFDNFNGFEQRGDYFLKAVEELRIENKKV